MRLQIWDTAGQERLRSIAKSYFRNAVGALLVYDITSLVSFDHVQEWYSDIQSLCVPNACVLLIGNKADLEAQREVGSQHAKNFADQNQLEPLETSALDGTGVTEAFTRLAYKIYDGVNKGTIKIPPPSQGMIPADRINGARACC
jgi:small GTP-binding protein